MEALINELTAALKPAIKKTVDHFFDSLKNDPVTDEAFKDICFIDEAAKLTGKSKQWLYECWKEIPGTVKHGKRIYFSKRNLKNWILGSINKN